MSVAPRRLGRGATSLGAQGDGVVVGARSLPVRGRGGGRGLPSLQFRVAPTARASLFLREWGGGGRGGRRKTLKECGGEGEGEGEGEEERRGGEGVGGAGAGAGEGEGEGEGGREGGRERTRERGTPGNPQGGRP